VHTKINSAIGRECVYLLCLKRSPNAAYSPRFLTVLWRLADGGEKVGDLVVERHPSPSPEAAALPGCVVIAAIIFFDFQCASASVLASGETRLHFWTCEYISRRGR
jgi:hypothetical protein